MEYNKYVSDSSSNITNTGESTTHLSKIISRSRITGSTPSNDQKALNLPALYYSNPSSSCLVQVAGLVPRQSLTEKPFTVLFKPNENLNADEIELINLLKTDPAKRKMLLDFFSQDKIDQTQYLDTIARIFDQGWNGSKKTFFSNLKPLESLQRLVWIPFVKKSFLGQRVPLFSENTMYYMYRFNAPIKPSVAKEVLTIPEYQNWANSLMIDLNENGEGLSEFINELYKNVDAQKFTELLFASNDLIFSSSDPRKVLKILRWSSYPDVIFDGILDDILYIPDEEGHHALPDYKKLAALNLIKTFIADWLNRNNNGNPFALITTNATTMHSEYSEEMKEFLKALNNIDPYFITKQNDVINAFARSFYTFLSARFAVEDSNVLKTDDPIAGYQRVLAKLKTADSIIARFEDNTNKFLRLLIQIINSKKIDDKRVLEQTNWKTIFTGGVEEFLEKQKEASGDEGLRDESLKTNKVKASLQTRLTSEERDGIHFYYPEAIKIIFKSLMGKFDGSLDSLEKKDIVPNYQRDTTKTSNQDFPYLFYKELISLFDLDKKQIEQFQSSIDYLRNKYHPRDNPVKRIVINVGLGFAVLVAAAGSFIAGKELTSKPEVPLYSVPAKTESEELKKMAPYKQLINEIINMLPEKFEFEANGKKYDIPRENFWVYEIPGVPNKVPIMNYDGLIKRITEEYPQLKGKEKEILKTIIDQANFLGTVWGTDTRNPDGSITSQQKLYSITPILIPIPPENNQFCFVYLFNTTAVLRSLEPDLEPRTLDAAISNLNYSIGRLPKGVELAIEYQDNPNIDPLTLRQTIERDYQRIHGEELNQRDLALRELIKKTQLHP
jgi:hypothetical protein